MIIQDICIVSNCFILKVFYSVVFSGKAQWMGLLAVVKWLSIFSLHGASKTPVFETPNDHVSSFNECSMSHFSKHRLTYFSLQQRVFKSAGHVACSVFPESLVSRRQGFQERGTPSAHLCLPPPRSQKSICGFWRERCASGNGAQNMRASVSF